MLSHVLVLIAIPVLFLAAAIWDLARFTIPNGVSLSLAAVFFAAALSTGLPPAAIAWHVLCGLLALAAGFSLFAFGYIGGGDAKLFAAIALVLGPAQVLNYALLASVLGGGLTLSLLWLRQMPLPAIASRQFWILRLHDTSEGVPYGVALAAGALLLLPYSDLAQLIAA